ncbi:hypothetical protein F5897_000703 [Canibacter oris]|uniref:HTH-like domain-containing protein n=1 Tax=Canibacter oris TaxID=1365628 RepID=A0A840DPC3_9MICO|nr:hypothetical protein [Canibacter oris]
MVEIERIHRDDPEFGYRFIADELHAKGLHVSERKVWKLCSRAGIFSQILSAKRKSRKAGPAVGDDLLQRHFRAERPNVGAGGG